jgi:formylglycine-generating enzyme required for sulfatase activity
MILLKAARMRTHSTVLGVLVTLVCVLAGILAKAQGNDLIIAAYNGDLSRIQALLAAGSNVNAQTGEGATALMYASYSGHVDVVRALLDAKADVNAKQINGTTALMSASGNGHLDVVRALLSAKADVNAKLLGTIQNGTLTDLARGLTALMLASQNGHQEVVQALLDANADVNAEASNGDTALMLASANDHPEAVRALLAKGADVNAKDKDGDTAMTRASKKGHIEVVQLLKSAGAQSGGRISSVPQATGSPIPAGMALIPAGAFMMGDSLDGDELLFGQRINGDATPTVEVEVSAFYMDKNLVTFSEWQSVYSWATKHGYSFVHAGSGKAANHPVRTVDWYDTVKWCNARSQQAGLTPVYYTDAGLKQVYTDGEIDSVYANWAANGYRLPTEAEWEKAARGGLSGQRFPWGNTISEDQANYHSTDEEPSYDLGPRGFNAAFATGGEPFTSPVGHFAANGYGLYDMAGNVQEWVWDWSAAYAGGSDPRGPASGTARILRGGSWQSYAAIPRVANRWPLKPPLSGDGIGFRCARQH